MNTILHISSSPRGAASASYQLSQQVMRRLLLKHPRAKVVARDLWRDQLPHVDGEYATALASRDRAPDGGPGSALARSDGLIAELRAADCVVLATPMHNYTVPSVLKAWIDHVLRIGHTFTATPKGKVGALADRPVYIAISAGGYRTGDKARQPDFLEPYLKAVLGTMGLHDVTVLSVQGLSAGGGQAAEGEAAAQLERCFGD